MTDTDSETIKNEKMAVRKMYNINCQINVNVIFLINVMFYFYIKPIIKK